MVVGESRAAPVDGAAVKSLDEVLSITTYKLNKGLVILLKAGAQDAEIILGHCYLKKVRGPTILLSLQARI